MRALCRIVGMFSCVRSQNHVKEALLGVKIARNEDIRVRFHSLVFALFGQPQYRNPVSKVFQSLFMCLECFRHALTVNQLAHFVGMQSRVTTWAVSSGDAEPGRAAEPYNAEASMVVGA